jgi:hypothetical protein
MVFERKSRKRGRRSEGEEVIEEEDPKILEMIEFSSPHGHKSHEKDALKVTYQQKNERYADLAEELTKSRNQQVRVTAVIVSSMGAVYIPSLKALQKVLKCSDRQISELGRKMLETALIGSLEIWRQDIYQRHPQPGEQKEWIITNETAELRRVEMEVVRLREADFGREDRKEKGERNRRRDKESED